ncbi:hypothetical protein [Candidatus Similichlamydia laticola]|uniref:Uncharacterized protein n=1 Tax=Candidatus Similichlamydia laticola TaxID=2170265 RepID=A0A369KAI0_9BACT|nr:hypothetical protein [Candidatus Similichlamydia laticola]RDB31609.1 hypothetical protein HAT2_00284 [Candidatus Similichlamydia laticola]
MTLKTVSIPFSTSKQTGFTDLKVISHSEFVSIAERVSLTAKEALSKARPYFRRRILRESDHSLIVLPKNVTIDPFTGKTIHGQIFLVIEHGFLNIGFIPMPEEGCKLVQYSRLKEQFYHCQLNSISKRIGRIETPENKRSFFDLPASSKLEDSLGKSVLIGIHIMLLFDDKESTLALLCCKYLIPPVLPVPILYPKLRCQLVQEESSSPTQVEIFYSLDHQLGHIKIPCLSKEEFEQCICGSVPFKRSFKEGKGYSHKINTIQMQDDCLLVLPYGSSVNSKQQLCGGRLYLVGSHPKLELGFIPDATSKKVDYNSIVSFHRSLLDPLGVARKFIPAGSCTKILLGEEAKVLFPLNASPSVIGISLFLLSSRGKHFLSVLFKRGDYKLVGINPFNPNEGVLPLSKLMTCSEIEQELPSKRSRIESEPETSKQSQEILLNPSLEKPETGETVAIKLVEPENTSTYPNTEEERRAIAASGLLALAHIQTTSALNYHSETK